GPRLSSLALARNVAMPRSGARQFVAFPAHMFLFSPLWPTVKLPVDYHTPGLIAPSILPAGDLQALVLFSLPVPGNMLHAYVGGFRLPRFCSDTPDHTRESSLTSSNVTHCHPSLSVVAGYCQQVCSLHPEPALHH